MDKADILTAVIERTGRADLRDIDTELYGVLVDITNRHAFLKGNEEQSWVINTKSYDFPTDAVKILHITAKEPDSDNITTLLEIPFRTFLINANDKGAPKCYAVYNKKIYPYPTPDKDYTATIYYQKTHPADFYNILLDNTFKECVISGVCAEVFKALGQANEFQLHYASYEKHLSTLAINARGKEINEVDGYYTEGQK